MKHYREYKDSGVEWIGEVPRHWEIMKASLAFSNIGSGTTPSTSKPEFYDDEGIYWLQTGDLNDGLISTTSKKITHVALKQCNLKLWPVGSIVVAMYGATIGKVGCLQIQSATNQACCVMPINDRMDSMYSLYVFLSGKSELLISANGGGQPNISQDIIKKQRIPVPPISEQQAIAAYLDKKCGEINKMISKQQERIALLEELKQSIITHAVTKGLDPNAQMKDSGVEWIGEVPSHWETCRFKDFITLENTSSSRTHKIGLENIEGKTGKFISTNTIFEGDGIDFDRGDIVYGKLRPYLQKVWIADFEGNAIGDFFVFRTKSYSYNQYVKYLFLSDGFTREADGATAGAKMPRVSSEFILSLRYFIPPLSEQRAIAVYLDKKCTSIDSSIQKANHEIELLQEYKQSLIAEVVTGKRKVC